MSTSAGAMALAGLFTKYSSPSTAWPSCICAAAAASSAVSVNMLSSAAPEPLNTVLPLPLLESLPCLGVTGALPGSTAKAAVIEGAAVRLAQADHWQSAGTVLAPQKELLLLLRAVKDVQQLLGFEQAHIQHHLHLQKYDAVKGTCTKLHTHTGILFAVSQKSLSCQVHTHTRELLCYMTRVALHARCLAYLLQWVSPPDQPWLAVAGPQVRGLQFCKLVQYCCLACLT